MSPGQDPEQAVPENWIALVNDLCDLDLAYERLDGWTHFHTDTIRGRLRSLQLRPREAWEHFRRAETRVGEFPETHQNQMRAFFLKIYCFENALVEDLSPKREAPALDRWIKNLQQGDLPDSEIAVQRRLFHRATFHLYQQDFAKAKSIFLRLIEESHDQRVDQQTGFYFGLAAACRGLEEREESDRNLENACLSIPALENTFNMGMYGATAKACMEIWGRREEAREWKNFLLRLKIPRKTLDLWLDRARLIVERSESLKRVYLL